MAESGNSSMRRVAQASLPGAHPHPHPSHPHEPIPLPYHWHEKQEMMQRELEEARARATQMEKTMRWWSDCTANWREKWSKVRSERNKAREEVRILRGRLEVSQRENSALKREKNDMEAQMSHLSKTYHMVCPRKDSSLEQQEEPRSQGTHLRDSPERDGSVPLRPLSHPEAEKLSTDEMQFIRDAKNTNFSLLEEIFGSRGLHQASEAIGNGEEGVDGEGKALTLSGGVENVSVFVHKPSEATRLSEKCRAGREVKDLICDEYLQDTAVQEDPGTCHHHHHHHHHHHPPPQRENDVEEKMIHTQQHQQQEQAMREAAGGSSNSSSQPSPSHRISTMSDPLPDTTPCHVLNPRISAVSDPTSEVCGGSECSEGLFEEAGRPWEGVSGREVRCGSKRTSGGGGMGGCGGSLLDDSGITPEQESLEQQVTMLKLRLDEATKTIQAEREEKSVLDRECTKWQAETSELRLRLEDMRASRQDLMKELVALRAQHQKEVQSLQLEMLDEASTRECIDRRMADLRAELERLQEENAAEWGRRERLESEKLGFERETKKLRAQLGELEERLDKRNKMNTSCQDSDVAQLKQEIADK